MPITMTELSRLLIFVVPTISLAAIIFFFKKGTLFSNTSYTDLRKTSAQWLQKRLIVSLDGIDILGKINLISYRPYDHSFTVIRTDNDVTTISLIDANSAKLLKRDIVADFIKGNNRCTIDGPLIYVEQDDTFVCVYRLSDLHYMGKREWLFSGGDTIIDLDGETVIGYIKSELWENTLRKYVTNYITAYHPAVDSELPIITPHDVGVGAHTDEYSVCLYSKDHRIYNTYRISVYTLPKLKFAILRERFMRMFTG